MAFFFVQKSLFTFELYRLLFVLVFVCKSLLCLQPYFSLLDNPDEMLSLVFDTLPINFLTGDNRSISMEENQVRPYIRANLLVQRLCVFLQRDNNPSKSNLKIVHARSSPKRSPSEGFQNTTSLLHITYVFFYSF